MFCNFPCGPFDCQSTARKRFCSPRLFFSPTVQPIFHTCSREHADSREEEVPIRTKLQSRERAHQETRKQTMHELVLKEICCSQAEKTQELRMDSLSRHEEHSFEKELRESQFTVDQHTVQIEDFQDRINSLSDARDFTDFETASSFGSCHVPGQPCFFLSLFSASLRQQPAAQFAEFV